MVDTHHITLASHQPFAAKVGLSLLHAARAAGLVLEHGCRTGRCGRCQVRVLQGRTRDLLEDQVHTAAQRADGWALSCACTAATDLVLDAEAVPMEAGTIVQTLPARIATLARLAPDVLRVGLRLPPGTSLDHLAGQYIDVIAHGGVRRSYSLASAPGRAANLELHIRAVPGGVLSSYWFERAQPNDLLRLAGPHGSFCLRDVAQRDVVFLATGTGIAPIKAMLESLCERPLDAQPRSLQLLWGGRQPQDLYWQPGTMPVWFSHTPVLSRAGSTWTGARGHVQDVLLARQPDMRGVTAYACGAPAMIDTARRQLLHAGMSARDFHFDAFVSA